MEIDRFKGRYHFLSNFHISYIEHPVLGHMPTVEHGYQASKFPPGSQDRQDVLNSQEPGDAKTLAKILKSRQMTSFHSRKREIMQELVMMKFIQNPELAAMLLDTGHAKLIEGNTWGDTFWGVCNGVGYNHLGRILMTTRSLLRNAG